MDNFALPVSREVLYNELEMGRSILEKWATVVEKGIPGIDGQPAPPMETERVLRELIGELQVISGKCDTLADILSAAIV